MEGKAAYDEPVEAVSASCITGSAPYNEVYYFTRFEKDETMVEGPTYNATTVTRMEKSGLIVGLFRWRKINEVYSEQNKLVLGGCL